MVNVFHTTPQQGPAMHPGFLGPGFSGQGTSHRMPTSPFRGNASAQAFYSPQKQYATPVTYRRQNLANMSLIPATWDSLIRQVRIMMQAMVQPTWQGTENASLATIAANSDYSASNTHHFGYGRPSQWNGFGQLAGAI